MAQTNIPIPQDKIGESFVWRDWFQKLSNRVFGSMGGQDSNAVVITGGTINNTQIGLGTPDAAHFTEVQINTPLPISSGGTGGNSAGTARTALGVTATGGDTSYAFRANNLSDLASPSTALTTLLTAGGGYSGTVSLAKLTTGGSNGSLTLTNGIVTAYTAPT
jgi:hypothetical protein